MKIKLLFMMSFIFTGLYAQSASFNAFQSTDYIDREALILLKNELECAKKILLEIRNTQNPALIKTAVSSLGSVVKELMYILTAVALGGGCTLAGIGLIIGGDNFNRVLNNPWGQGATLIALPAVIFSVIMTYVFLKFIFRWLLASSNKDQATMNIKDALLYIDQTLNKLDYEIKKIERLQNVRYVR